ncbi:hypothetical protein ACF3DV_06905 [Chlorogloeopsis fritschii PCC 9212]|uniref:Uncharacterized protein n=1 Tax=Chlorogloeopsis fritschii PCC 6912 TaxID=211165 RepID=A0A433N5J0_CHLFR|nr:hypothetical protein [Chlorogloeopsis fritschii]RUR76719.1 hypothetical protein PCC6912_41230 [Chlorogloeopsis fritschii PCC 6912]
MYKFAAAWENEPIVFGAAKPGYSNAKAHDWVEFMKRSGIKRVCCFLSKRPSRKKPVAVVS